MTRLDIFNKHYTVSLPENNVSMKLDISKLTTSYFGSPFHPSEMNRYKILDLKVELLSPYLPGVDEGRVEEALRCQDGVEVVAGEAP